MRHKMLRLVKACDENLRSHGRNFTAVLGPPASEDEIAEAERKLGFGLPATLRKFLAEFNGIKLSSLASEYDEMLIVSNLRRLVIDSMRAYELVQDDRKDRGLSGDAPPCLQCGQYLDGDIMLRIGERRDGHMMTEPVARIRWDLESSWREIAESFEDWLIRSLESMAQTANGFQYFGSIPLW